MKWLSLMPRAAGSDEQILVVVGHADHFMGHHLADRENQIVSAFPHQPVELRGPRFAVDALGGFGHDVGGNFADRDTSFRQSCTRNNRLGTVGNMRSSCQSDIAACVPNAGMTSTSRSPKYS